MMLCEFRRRRLALKTFLQRLIDAAGVYFAYFREADREFVPAC